MKPLLYLIACATLGGCTLDPNFTRPEPPVPAQWPVGGAYGQRAQSLGASENVAATGGSATPSEMVAQPVAWQEFVRDARLKQVIDLYRQGIRMTVGLPPSMAKDIRQHITS
ncbi:MAG: hypothetical protein EOO27_40670, partial [Comamonadaceae bacterium]